jgi:hypothetical protein
MKIIRNALLGVALALPLFAAAGHAQTAIRENGRNITVPPGAVVMIIPGAGVSSVAPPAIKVMPQTTAILRMIDQQQIDVQHMLQQINTLLPPMMPMPNPTQLFRAAFGGEGPMLTMAGAPAVCSQSVTIVQSGNRAPVITHSESGCNPVPSRQPADVREPPPVSATTDHAPRLIQARYAPRNEPPTNNLIAER